MPFFVENILNYEMYMLSILTCEIKPLKKKSYTVAISEYPWSIKGYILKRKHQYTMYKTKKTV